jgi:hypothetical protein
MHSYVLLARHYANIMQVSKMMGSSRMARSKQTVERLLTTRTSSEDEVRPIFELLLESSSRVISRLQYQR